MKNVVIILFTTMFAFSCGESNLKKNQEENFKNYLFSVEDTNLFLTDYEDCLVAVYHTDDTVYCICLGEKNSYIQASPKDYFKKTEYKDVSKKEAESFLMKLIN